MNIITPKFEILKQQYNKETLLEDMFKHIEICGRTCYKSEDKITDTSYEKFVKMLEESEHGAMLEHGTVYLTIPLGTPIDDPQYMWKHDIVSFFSKNKYSVVKEKTINETVDVEIKGYGMQTQASAHFYFITTNWRVIYENRNKILVKYLNNNYHFDKETVKDSVLQWMVEPSEEHEKRYTVRFTLNGRTIIVEKVLPFNVMWYYLDEWWKYQPIIFHLHNTPIFWFMLRVQKYKYE